MRHKDVFECDTTDAKPVKIDYDLTDTVIFDEPLTFRLFNLAANIFADYPWDDIESVTVKVTSPKWCRIAVRGENTHTVQAFVALANFTTKQLGEIKKGNLYKPACWKRASNQLVSNLYELKRSRYRTIDAE